VSGDKKNIIIYNTVDGKASVSLYGGRKIISK